ncbi:MAG: hypothetical protein R2911_40185 [Caldilineaceae bacterium]
MRTGVGHSPHFYGGDRSNGFILLEDMGHDHGSLVEPLLGDDAAAAEQALLHFAERLAHMHVDTAGRADEFYALVESLNPQMADQMRNGEPFAQQRAKVATALADLGVEMTTAANRFRYGGGGVLANPGPLRVYLHGDPRPTTFGRALICASWILSLVLLATPCTIWPMDASIFQAVGAATACRTP